MRAIAALSLLALLSPAAAARRPDPNGAAALQQKLAGLVPGKPTDCVPQGPSARSQNFDGAILYEYGSTTYVNRFGGSCTLRPNFDALVTRTYSTQLCRGDIAQVVDTAANFPRGSCVFDTFETYTRPKKPR